VPKVSVEAMAKQNTRVLIVDDDADLAEALSVALTGDGYSCELAGNGAAAIQALARHPFDAVISDVQMSGMGGLELLDRLAKSHPALPVIMMTAFSRLGDAVDATKRGAFQYLAKPYEVRTLEDMVAQAIRQRRDDDALAPAGEDRPLRRHEIHRLQGASPTLLGSEPAMVALLECIRRVAASSAPVLIAGESGAGKDLDAHAIHAQGPRRDRPFVAINASAIPEALLESEIFGHARGAFTGASEARRGLFVTAQGGTLFLDEIGDMPLALQAKLLRVLELGEVRAVGSDSVRSVDVRVIAASHRDLGKLVEAGRFRQDLYFRLNVLPVAVPPLRERRRDIAELAVHFLEQARLRMPTSPVRNLSPDALEALSSAPWPGNVRELSSTMERLVVFGRAETLTSSDVGLGAKELPKAREPESAEMCTLRHLNERHVAWVLTQTAGNKVRAAEILGINLSTLYRRQRPKGE
jgi:two-component system response regulator HydG